jgi:hypothetical protein
MVSLGAFITTEHQPAAYDTLWTAPHTCRLLYHYWFTDHWRRFIIVIAAIGVPLIPRLLSSANSTRDAQSSPQERGYYSRPSRT